MVPYSERFKTNTFLEFENLDSRNAKNERFESIENETYSTYRSVVEIFCP